ncbi:hypothetical protein PFISCL1PPCAC_20613 [Pristionchus fissidentatus]|uniref:Ubiquitin-like domain-containing protein n=1 Tax=Pristionchus fissidentatus TaxID=1538716 RepID=A0AAV5WEL0_9BILA|nr:hypothetical protein PFISCL1PPCAC_20613 [Pristionchus fissidentatus]
MQQDEYPVVDIQLCPETGEVVDQCVACHEAIRSVIEAERYVYDAAYVYVKLQTDEPSTSKGGEKEEKEGKEGKEGKGSKESSEENSENVPLQIVTTSSGRTVMPVTMPGRSCTRRGQSKGLIKVKMSSSQTVKELKIALLKHVNYSPVDQLLYSTVGGDPLQDERTLMEARVLPDNHEEPIILIVQSATEGMLCSPANEKNRAVERGFYDTALAH